MWPWPYHVISPHLGLAGAASRCSPHYTGLSKAGCSSQHKSDLPLCFTPTFPSQSPFFPSNCSQFQFGLGLNCRNDAAVPQNYISILQFPRQELDETDRRLHDTPPSLQPLFSPGVGGWGGGAGVEDEMDLHPTDCRII